MSGRRKPGAGDGWGVRSQFRFQGVDRYGLTGGERLQDCGHSTPVRSGHSTSWSYAPGRLCYTPLHDRDVLEPRSMKKPAFFAIAIAILPATAFAAPRGMYGKHFKMTWTETRSQRIAGQTAFRPVSIPCTYTVYVGTEGKGFKRRSGISASLDAMNTSST